MNDALVKQITELAKSTSAGSQMLDLSGLLAVIKIDLADRPAAWALYKQTVRALRSAQANAY